MRWPGKNVSFCAPATTEIMKTNNVPLKTPIKLLPEMKKEFWNFQNLFGFRDLFWKSNFLENGRGRHQIGAIPIHYTFIFNQSQWGSPPESFIQKYWQVSKLPIFQNHFFFKKGPKSSKIFEKLEFFFHFWQEFRRVFQWYIVCLNTLSGYRGTEGNVAVSFQLATTVLQSWRN